MLSSTRASALAFSLAHRALPAESSKQGLLRAIAQQRAASTATASASVKSKVAIATGSGQKRELHRRRNGSTYATAAAFAEEERSDRVDHEYEGWRTTTTNRRFPDPRPPDLVRTESAAVEHKETEGLVRGNENVGELPSIDELREMMRSEPIQALRLLPHYSSADLSILSFSNLSVLLKEIYKASNDSHVNYPKRSQTVFDRPLMTLRGLLHDLPSSTGSNDKHLGKRFKLDVLGRFLRTCAILGCDDVLQSTLRERLEAQRITGQVVVLPDMWTAALANRNDWKSIIDLLSPSDFPIESYTPYTIYRLMQAHLGIGNIAKVPILFRLYTELDLEPPPRAYVVLVQAHLGLGDLDTARKVMTRSLRGNKTDEVSVQLAILKGYRELGRDVALEDRVLEALDGMEQKNQAAMLHALIRLRLDAGEVMAAKDLLRRFDCDYWVSMAGLKRAKDTTARLLTDTQTHYLAFRMLAPSMSMEQLERSWEYLQSNSVPTTDQFVRVLIDTLVRLNQISTARDLLSGKALEGGPAISLPETYRPGPVILNTVLEHSSTEGWKGLEKGLKLFRSLDIKPDEQTLNIILAYVRDNITRDPTALANLANSIIRQSTDIKPTIDHMDTLLAQAVRAHARASQLAASSTTEPEPTFNPSDEISTTAQAGLNARDPFHSAVRSMVQSLRARGVRSMSRSLATRLRYDAQTHTRLQRTEEGMTKAPSVRAVWDDLISRGYKPDKRHFLALMKGYADSGHMTECEDVIILARDLGVEPTRGMWMVLMSSYGRARNPWFDLTKSEKAFHAIRTSEQGLDIPAVCAMIGIYQRGGRRQAAVDLALRLVGNIVNPSTSSPMPGSTRKSQWSIPNFKPSEFTDRSLAMITAALRIDHPALSLQIISMTYPTKSFPTRVREVVKSIRNRARARIARGIALATDCELLTQAEAMVKTSGGSGGRKIGPEGMKRKIARLLERRKTRGAGGRRLIGAKAERRFRYETMTRGGKL